MAGRSQKELLKYSESFKLQVVKDIEASGIPVCGALVTQGCPSGFLSTQPEADLVCTKRQSVTGRESMFEYRWETSVAVSTEIPRSDPRVCYIYLMHGWSAWTKNSVLTLQSLGFHQEPILLRLQGKRVCCPGAL